MWRGRDSAHIGLSLNFSFNCKATGLFFELIVAPMALKSIRDVRPTRSDESVLRAMRGVAAEGIKVAAKLQVSRALLATSRQQCGQAK